jgi:hypothetical protein
MKAPVSHLKDPDLRGVPDALLRAAEKARRLAEQTGTPFIVRQPASPPGTPSDEATGKRGTDGALSAPTGST